MNITTTNEDNETIDLEVSVPQKTLKHHESLTLSETSLALSISASKSTQSLPESSSTSTDSPKSPRENVNIAILGGGLAGLSAAISAHESFQSLKNSDPSKYLSYCITVFEAAQNLGGNSSKASSGMNACSTPAQKEKGIEDSPEKLIETSIKTGQGFASYPHIKVMAENSPEALRFVERISDIQMTDLHLCGGHDNIHRTHRQHQNLGEKPINVGWAIMKGFINYVNDTSEIIVKTSATVKKITRCTHSEKFEIYLENPSPASKTQMIEKLETNYDFILLATGGFSYHSPKNHFLSRYSKFSELPTTNSPTTLGDGMEIGYSLGGQLVQLDRIQIHPTGFVNPKDPFSRSKFLAGEALRGCGAILVDSFGNRFCDELSSRDNVSTAIEEIRFHFPVKIEPTSHLLDVVRDSRSSFSIRNPPSDYGAWMIMNSDVSQSFGQSLFDFYVKFGLIQEHSTFHDMCKALSINPNTLDQTFKLYSNGKPDEFGRTVKNVKFQSTSSTPSMKWYSAFICPCIHYSMGGLKIDLHSRVLDVNDIPIPQLFAAGEVTGGIHGVRLGGNSLLDCVVFGRIAGSQIVFDALSTKHDG